jgi:hypothetical protein
MYDGHVCWLEQKRFPALPPSIYSTGPSCHQPSLAQPGIRAQGCNRIRFRQRLRAMSTCRHGWIVDLCCGMTRSWFHSQDVPWRLMLSDAGRWRKGASLGERKEPGLDQSSHDERPVNDRRRLPKIPRSTRPSPCRQKWYSDHYCDVNNTVCVTGCFRDWPGSHKY